MYKIPKQKARLRENTKKLEFNKYRKYQTFIKDIGLCQVCEESIELDTPHHSIYGAGKKDDRSLVCICAECHYNIHSRGYEFINKTRKQIEKIGSKNLDIYLISV